MCRLNTRLFRIAVAALLSLAGTTVIVNRVGATTDADAVVQPNIVFILADDMVK